MVYSWGKDNTGVGQRRRCKVAYIIVYCNILCRYVIVKRELAMINLPSQHQQNYLIMYLILCMTGRTVKELAELDVTT